MSESRADGTYVVTPVRIGVYTVEVEFKGFQKSRRMGVQVSIQQQVVADFSLKPGELTQTVEVEAAAPLLQTQSGSVGEVVSSQTINNLPLSGRNYNFLARLTAGVTHSQPEGRGLAATGWFAANGTRPAQNNFLLDGIDNNSNNVDFLSGAAYVIKPPVDAIGEFKLQTNAFSAEFGRAGGAVLNASIKSGTNQFHGSAWEFLRNDKIDAADFFQHYPGGGKGAFKQNQFGVSRWRTHREEQNVLLHRLRRHPHPAGTAVDRHLRADGSGTEQRLYELFGPDFPPERHQRTRRPRPHLSTRHHFRPRHTRRHTGANNGSRSATRSRVTLFQQVGWIRTR